MGGGDYSRGVGGGGGDYSREAITSNNPTKEGRLIEGWLVSLPKPRNTTYGLHSFPYLAAKLWSSLPGDLSICSNVNGFKRKIHSFVKF